MTEGRCIILDTETTGLRARDGDRVVEIGAVALDSLVATGEPFHRYINPECPMPAAATEVHGLTDAFLADKPRFAEVVADFLAFVGDAPLVIHNAAFDMGFLNAELARLGFPALDNPVVDTLALARSRFPGAQATLDALCRRFNVDNSTREKHGALLDAELLAEVYVELCGGRQIGLGLDPTPAATAGPTEGPAPRPTRRPRPHTPTAAELARHAAFVARLKDPVWTL